MKPAKLHRFVRIPEVEDYLRAGWMPLPSLAGTVHGLWSVHLVWLCDCEPFELLSPALQGAPGRRSSEPTGPAVPPGGYAQASPGMGEGPGAAHQLREVR